MKIPSFSNIPDIGVIYTRAQLKMNQRVYTFKQNKVLQ